MLPSAPRIASSAEAIARTRDSSIFGRRDTARHTRSEDREAIPDPMHHQQGLLRLALDRNEPHAWPLDGLTTTLGIRRVMLVGLDIRFDKLG